MTRTVVADLPKKVTVVHIKRAWFILSLCLVVLWMLFASVSFAAEVTNLDAKQEGNSIIFDFDITGESGETETEVMVVISVDGKELRDNQLHLEGDHGKVTVGKGKKISWNVLKDFPNGLGGDISWGVTAKRSVETLSTQKDNVNSLLGKWTIISGEFVGRSVEYRQDGSIIFSSGATNRYRIIDEGKLEVISYAGKSTIFSFKISNNQLTLVTISGINAGKPPIVHTRVTSPAEHRQQVR